MPINFQKPHQIFLVLMNFYVRKKWIPMGRKTEQKPEQFIININYLLLAASYAVSSFFYKKTYIWQQMLSSKMERPLS